VTAKEFRSNADAFTKSYLETALWSSTDDNDRPLDSEHSVGDLADATLDSIVADCTRFQSENESLLTAENCLRPSRSGNPGHPVDIRAGHDFWLTRNGHGAGFWDGDWEEPAGAALTAASEAFGETSLYIGDDGLLYLA
jgi:hypothetical protein